jgi:putative ABC transport system ATP-binding protein
VLGPGIPTDTVVRAVDVRKAFETAAGRVEVLRGVDFDVGRGERLAITGESGSGKSTLLSLLAGLDEPTAGRLIVDGIDPAQRDEAGLADFRARTIGIVFQHFHLMKNLTALENIRLPLELRGDLEIAGRAEDALARVGLAARAHHFPAQLSGGESQRVALARAIVTDPTILLADEPTGNLDEKTGHRVMDHLFEVVAASATTLILVTHSQPLASRCATTLTLVEGRLA